MTTLLRAIGYSSDSEILELFASEDNAEDRQFIRATIEKERLSAMKNLLCSIFTANSGLGSA